MFNGCVASVRTLTILPNVFDWQLHYLQGYVSQTYTRRYKASWKQFALATWEEKGAETCFVGHFAAISLPTNYLEKYSQTRMALQDNLSIFLYIKARIQALQNSLEWKRPIAF